MFSVVTLSVCKHHYSKNYEQIAMKLYGGFRGCERKKCLKFGGNLGLLE